MRPPPDVFAAVMATGIVSISAADHGYRWISLALAVIAACALPVLVVACALSWRRSPPDFFRDPDVLLRMFTYVAACAVLGARLAEYRIALWILAALALQFFWLTLTPVVIRRMWRIRWIGLRDCSHGAWELASVATSGVAILAADLHWLFGALVFWALALVVYAVMTALILWRAFHERLDPGGFEPDGWILMGGLAIATLAGDRIHRVWPADAVVAITVVTWVLATLWIPVLVYFAIRRLNLRRVGGVSGGCVVGDGVPAGHVLGGDVRDVARNRSGCVRHHVAGVLLGGVRGVADRDRQRIAVPAFTSPRVRHRPVKRHR